MLLSGIVITLAFLLTALTLSQVSSLERQAASEKATPLAAEWRFLRDRVATNLDSAVPADLRVDVFKSVTFPTIAATFRGIEAEKGYDAVLRLADSPTRYNLSEESILVNDGAGGKKYEAWSADGSFHFTAAWDGTNDGVIHYATCPDETVVGACIAGVVVFLHMTDTSSTMSEVVVYAVNSG